MHHRLPIAGSLFVTTCLLGCGGGGSDAPTVISGITAPEQISFITPDVTILGTAPPGTAPGANVYPLGSDYATDQASVYVFDPAMEPLETINTILCTMSMTAYDEMINEGNYKAQYELALCEKPRENDSQGAEGGVPETNILTANSSRTSATGPQAVSVWVPFPWATIYAQLILVEGVSETNPFGVWGLNYAGANDVTGIGTPAEFGFLRTANATSGSIGFDFAQQRGDVDSPPPLNDQAQTVRAAVVIDPVANTGSARIVNIRRENHGGIDSGQLVSNIKMAFNATHMKTQWDSDPIVTLSRTNFHNAVHRYNLYYAEGPNMGQQVELNSGFPILTDQGAYGWMGYWGLWTENNSVSNGDTIYRANNDGTQGDAYTVLVAPGKLVRNARSELALVDLGNARFEWWNAGSRFLVDFDGTDFRVIAFWNDVNLEWEEVTPSVIVVANVGGELNMWSPSLGGSVRYADGDASITYFSRAYVNGADELFTSTQNGEVELFGYFMCLDTALTGTDVDNGQVHLSTAPDVNTPYGYRINQSNLTLELDVNGDGSVWEAAGLAPGEAPQSGPYFYGFSSGPMVPDTAGFQTMFDIYEVPVYYTYETGHNPWNQYTAIQDSNGATVQFDAPIQFLYEHATANDLNDDNSFDGQSFVLEYNGPGNLHGIPHEQIDLNGDSSTDVWRPQVNLRAGVVMGPNGTEYVVRPISIEQTLTLDPGGAPSLDLTAADALTLPSLSSYVTPTIGEKPVVTETPRVINGIVQ